MTLSDILPIIPMKIIFKMRQYLWNNMEDTGSNYVNDNGYNVNYFTCAWTSEKFRSKNVFIRYWGDF